MKIKSDNLQDSNKISIKVRELYSVSPVGILILNSEDYRIEFANTSFQQSTDLTNLEDELFFENFKESKKKLQPVFENVVNSGVSIELDEVVLKYSANGLPVKKYFTLLCKPYQDSHKSILLILNDVTTIINSKMTLLEREQYLSELIQSIETKKITGGIKPEEKNADKLISENEEKLEIVISASGLGTWELNVKTREVTYSKRYLEIFGYTEEVSLSHTEIVNHLHAEDRPIREKAFRDAFETGLLEYSSRIIWQDGSVHWIDAKGKVLFDEQHIPYKLIGTLRDITEEKLYQHKIEESESRMRIAALSSELGTWHYTISTGELRWDNASRELFGVSHDEPVTLELFWSRMHPEDHENALQKMLRALDPAIADNYDTEYRVIGLPENKTRWIHAKGKAFFNEKNEPILFSGTILDITDKRYATKELEESEQKFRLLADSMPQFIWTGDVNGNLNYFNKSVYDYSGLHTDEVKDGGWIKIVHPDDRELNVKKWMHSVSTGEDFLFEHRFLRKDGEYRWQLSRALAKKDNNGKIQMWVGTSTDIHDQKSFSQQLEAKVLERTMELKEINNQLAKSNHDLEQFAYIASHDLQEPLRKILTFSDALQKNLNDSVKAEKYFDKINSSANRMSDLIHSVLNYSRLSSGINHFDQVDLNGVLENVKSDFELLITEKQAIINCDKLPVIKGIPLQINQLFSNLINNSLKFSDINPRINISYSVKNYTEIPIHDINVEDEKFLEIIFKDNGIGFEQKYASQIFTIFQRLHGRHNYAGTGIGLALVKKIMENHSGFIHAISEKGKGASFYLYFPLPLV